MCLSFSHRSGAIEPLESRVLLSAAYVATDLSALSPEGDFLGTAINDAGQVVGSASEADKHTYAFLYTNGTMKDLGSLYPAGTSGASSAHAINANGDVTGQAAGPNGAHAFLYKNGVMQDLGALDFPNGYNTSTGTGVNSSDQVVGNSTADNKPISHAFLYNNGKMQDLGTPFGGTQSQATGINGSGQIIGYSQAPDRQHGFVYANGTFTDLGQLASAQGDVEPLAINNVGQVVGTSAAHAFLYSGGKMTDLGFLSGFNISRAEAVNSAGDVVGTSYGGLSYGRAFLYSSGTLQDLNDLVPPITGYTLTDARAINASGQIVCDGVNTAAAGTPVTHTFLLTPSVLTVGSPNFDYRRLPLKLSLTFSENVAASLTKASLQVSNIGTGVAIVPSGFTYDAANNTATFTFATPFPDAAYRAVLPAAAVSDTSGRHPAADFSYTFFALAGDANHDGIVNFADLLVLAQNYGKSNVTFGQGDFNYDGTVSFPDLLILAQHYGRSLPALVARHRNDSPRPCP